MSIHVSAALMAVPLLALAASPEPVADKPQTEVKAGSGLPPATIADMTAKQQEFPGIAWGSFLAYPDVTLAATYDDNIYGQRSGVVEDTVFTLSTSLALKSKWDRHALNFDAGADLDRYLDRDDENVNDYWAELDGRYDLSKTSNIFGGARFSRDHEDRSSADALAALQQKEPTRFDHSESHLGFATRLGQFRILAGGSYDQYDYKDGASVGGANLDNDFRDRDMHSLGARVSYAASANHEPFIQFATDVRNYDNNISALAPFNRDSDGYRLAAGLKFKYPKQAITGEVYAGTMQQEFDYTGFSDISKPYFGALLNWRPTPLISVNGFIDRSLEETTVYDAGTDAAGDETYASSSLDATYGFEVERKLTSRLTVNGRAAYTRSEYQGIDRADTVIDAGAGLRYYVTPAVYVGADLRVIDRDSDDQLAEYSRNQVMLSLGYTPARKRDYSIIPEGEAGAPRAPGASGLFSGFYLGAQLGQGGLTTTTSGPRGGGGSDSGDMGAIGESYGLFAGWGQEFGNWYLGAEVDASDSNADWFHSKDKPDSRTMSVDKNTSYGINLRTGYVLDGGLLYGKLGLVRGNFDTYYTENQYAPAGAYNQDGDEDGVRVGVGLEIPASPNLFVRLDYSYTDYGSYGVPYQSSDTGDITTEKFELADSVFSLGLGWRFGGERPSATRRLPTELRGFYAGASVGHGTLNTELSGTHVDQSTPPPVDFYGDFASPGFTGGFFAGYGYTFNRFYVGLDLEAEAANFGWYHSREVGGEDAGGRDFAVEKRGGYGAGLRLGYALDNGALLYGRIGAVRTRFNTIYEKGAGSSHWIDRSDRLNGTRVGLGAEIPASRHAFVRMDYSYTSYDSYGFVTGHNAGLNPDDMNFDNHESLARLGLGFRF